MPGGLALLDANVLLGFASASLNTSALLQSARLRPRSFAAAEAVVAEYRGLTGGPPPSWLATYRLPASCEPAYTSLKARFAPALAPADLEQLAALHGPGVACVVTSDEQMQRASAAEPRLRGKVHKPDDLMTILRTITGQSEKDNPIPRNPTQAIGTKTRAPAQAAPQLPEELHDERRYGHWKGGKFYLDD